MKLLVSSVLLLGSLQAFACEDLVGTYYCGKDENGYPASVYRVSRSGSQLKLEVGLFGGSKMVIPRKPGTGSLRQNNGRIDAELTRCSRGAISTLSRMSEEDGSIVLSIATHLVKKGEQVSIHYASVQPSRTGVTNRQEFGEACRKVTLSEHAWTRTKAVTTLIVNLITGKGPYGN